MDLKHKGITFAPMSNRSSKKFPEFRPLHEVSRRTHSRVCGSHHMCFTLNCPDPEKTPTEKRNTQLNTEPVRRFVE
ncbi:unnamed protein product [Arctogadus glacialis]